MRKLKWILAIVLVLGICLAGLIYHLVKDVSAAKDDDLRLVRLEIPEEENAYMYFRLAGESLYWPEKPIIRWDDDTLAPDLVADLLDKNAGTFECFEKGLACRATQAPQSMSGQDQLTRLQDWRELANLVALRASVLFRQGKEKEAFDEAMKIVRFGGMIEGSRGPLLPWLVGVAVKAIGLRRLRDLLQQTSLPPDVLMQYVGELSQYEVDEAALADVFRAEYMRAAKMIDDLAFGTAGSSAPGLASGWVFRRVLFRNNETKRLYAQTYRRLIEDIPNSYAQRVNFRAGDEQSGGFFDLAGRIAAGNAVGTMLHDMLLPALAELQATKYVENMLVRATWLLFAIKCYKLETGQLPETLDALVPDYIDKVPLDPYDGRPMRYSREKKRVYSIGEDLKDVGGLDGAEFSDRDEPTFPIEF